VYLKVIMYFLIYDTDEKKHLMIHCLKNWSIVILTAFILCIYNSL